MENMTDLKTNGGVMVTAFGRHSDLLNLANFVAEVIRDCQEAAVHVTVDQQVIDGIDCEAEGALLVVGFWRLLRQYHDTKPSLVYVCGPSLKASFLILLQKVFLRQSVVHLHRLDYESFGLVKSLGLRVYNLFMALLVTEIVVHTRVTSGLRRKVNVLPLPLHNPRSGCGQPAREKYILFFGRIERSKGLDRVIELALGLPQCPVRVVGECVDTSQLAVITEAKGIANIDVQEGRVEESEVADLLENARLIVLPYKSATQSGLPLLAASYAVPVLATDVGDLKETIEVLGVGKAIPYDLSQWISLIECDAIKAVSSAGSNYQMEATAKYTDMLRSLF